MDIKPAREYSLEQYEWDETDQNNAKKITERINHLAKYQKWEVDKMWLTPRETRLVVLFVRPIELRMT